MRNANLEAIKAKRGQGINIKILLGEPEEDEMKPSDEMAPEATELNEHEESAGAKDVGLEQMMSKEEPSEDKLMPQGDMSKGYDEEMMKGMDMSEHMPSHKPRSIGERAKAALMMRMKK